MLHYYFSVVVGSREGIAKYGIGGDSTWTRIQLGSRYKRDLLTSVLAARFRRQPNTIPPVQGVTRYNQMEIAING